MRVYDMSFTCEYFPSGRDEYMRAMVSMPGCPFVYDVDKMLIVVPDRTVPHSYRIMGAKLTTLLADIPNLPRALRLFLHGTRSDPRGWTTDFAPSLTGPKWTDQVLSDAFGTNHSCVAINPLKPALGYVAVLDGYYLHSVIRILNPFYTGKTRGTHQSQPFLWNAEASEARWWKTRPPKKDLRPVVYRMLQAVEEYVQGGSLYALTRAGRRFGIPDFEIKQGVSSAHLLLVAEDDSIYLVRGKSGWMTPGGQVDTPNFDDALFETMTREFEEETGGVLPDLNPGWSWYNNADGTNGARTYIASIRADSRYVAPL